MIVVKGELARRGHARGRRVDAVSRIVVRGSERSQFQRVALELARGQESGHTKQADIAIRVTAVLLYHRSRCSQQQQRVGRKDQSLFRRRCTSALGKFQGLETDIMYF
jgi:hypothetical protein